MSETPPRPAPRIEEEAALSPRLEFAAPLVVAPAPPPGGLVPVLAGTAILGFGLGGLAAAEFVADAFARGPLQGGVAAFVFALGFGLVLLGVGREVRGLLALRHVDALRAGLAADDIATVRRAARDWLAELPDQEKLTAALAVIEDPAAIRALLRAGPAVELRDQADQRARMAAVQMAAIIAATPSVALDALAMGWRGVRLVREVAALHGLRPGLLGTLALLRRTAFAAASVAATELAVNAATHALLSNPLLERLLGDMAGAGVAARRMIVLARAASLACSPLSPPD